MLVLCLMTPGVARGADGGLYLYLQPLASEASKLTFTVAAVSAVSVGGTEYPLKVNLKGIRQPDNARQRLLASGRVPAGSYAGLMFTVKSASLKNEGGEAALQVPDSPVRLDFPFAVGREQSPLVWLTLKYPESVTGRFSFNPVFWAVIPTRPIADHAAFVSNSASNTLTVLDKNLAQAVAVIDTCAGPAGLALDQYRRRLYVACTKDDEIQSIDVETGEIRDRTRMSPGDRPRELALTSDGSVLMTVNAGSNSVTFLDAITLTRQERINVGNEPESIRIEPAGRRAFVFDTFSSSVTVIDVSKRSVATTMSTESAPLRGQFNRRGDRLYVIHERSPYMTVVDPAQLTILTRARLRGAATAIAFDAVRDLICVGGGNDAAIDFYDPNALMPLYSMRTRGVVSYVGIDAQESRLYMVSPETRSVAIARLADRKGVSEIDVGDGPYWVAIMGEK